MEWISVKDRLPKMYERVLTYCPEFPRMPIKVNYIHTYDNEWAYDHSREITHWLPLPEPPE